MYTELSKLRGLSQKMKKIGIDVDNLYTVKICSPVYVPQTCPKYYKVYWEKYDFACVSVTSG